ncbi:MAG: class I tRNA ligase family protein [Candidatus Paceibacterota bacterium]|jgi:leucyl-tRNA synthetase
MKEYDHKKIELKWQKDWEKKKIFSAINGSKKPKFYALIEFPYLSGSGLHIGHIRSNTAMDIISRKRWMEGYNVMYPIGYDAFGLPTENYAIKTGKQPTIINKENTEMFRRQLKKIGFAFDWSRELNTANPAYYKWTQWIFLQMFKKGLAYKQKTMINWCPKDKIGLANEEVVNGKCERCGTETIKKEKEQWMLAITKYAERLDKDLDDVDYLERIKAQQRNWIGKSEGSEIEFKVKGDSQSVRVFTTRADTILGVTYVVLAPESVLVQNLKSQITNWNEVEKYIEKVKKESEQERTKEDKEKTGVELKGIKAINPANKEELPVWIADYVLASYGTGAVMAVPQHDSRDKEFAEKFNLSIIDRPLVDAEEITKRVGGKMVTKYKLRDWIFSRQRYWGEPIPLIHCDRCALNDPDGQGYIPVPDKDLPVVLPKVKSYTPTDTGESPLANISKWVNVKCPKCGGKARRETDTMPNWAGSSWYYLRYTDPKNKKEFASAKNLKYWTPVDWYNGGMEHTTLHLLYSRFWHKFLYDMKLVPTKEPYKKRTAHGMILAEDGEKMSKSRGNVVNPDEIVKLYGADTFRLYEMFIGPFDQTVTWNTNSIIGPRRFLEKVWKIGEKITTQKQINSSRLTLKGSDTTKNFSVSASFQTLLNKTIKKVSEDIESMSFNTAVSSMMVLVNEMEKQDVDKKDFKIFLQILAPFAPHITEELWNMLGEKQSINKSKWPKWDEKKIIDDKIKIAVQINGKVRTEIMVSKDMSEGEIKPLVLKDQKIISWMEGKEIKKFIYVPNRIINIVI